MRNVPNVCYRVGQASCLPAPAQPARQNLRALKRPPGRQDACPTLVGCLALLGKFSLLVILAVSFTSCSHKQEARENIQLPTASVRVQAVESGNQPAIEEVMGTVKAKLQATIEAKVAGKIESLPVSLGQSVRSGDLLVQLDVREIEAKLDQAKATRQQAERDFRRISALLEKQAATQNEFDAAQARYRIAKAATIEAESMLSYARVTAPFDGVITRKQADVGDLAMPGKPLLVMENPGALRFVADVPDAISSYIQPGKVLKVKLGSGAQTVEGTVSEIAPSADPISRTVEVKLDLPSADGMRSGTFGRLEVPLSEISTLRVPQSAVSRRGQMEFVFVVKDRKAHLRLVKTGKQANGQVELLSGVTSGEKIVVEGADELSDGQPVEWK